MHGVGLVESPGGHRWAIAVLARGWAGYDDDTTAYAELDRVGRPDLLRPVQRRPHDMHVLSRPGEAVEQHRDRGADRIAAPAGGEHAPLHGDVGDRQDVDAGRRGRQRQLRQQRDRPAVAHGSQHDRGLSAVVADVRLEAHRPAGPAHGRPARGLGRVRRPDLPGQVGQRQGTGEAAGRRGDVEGLDEQLDHHEVVERRPGSVVVVVGHDQVELAEAQPAHAVVAVDLQHGDP